MYAVSATVRRAENGWTSVLQVPTFYLDPNVQGIVDEKHAEQIALEIILPVRVEGVVVTVSVAKV